MAFLGGKFSSHVPGQWWFQMSQKGIDVRIINRKIYISSYGILNKSYPQSSIKFEYFFKSMQNLIDLQNLTKCLLWPLVCDGSIRQQTGRPSWGIDSESDPAGDYLTIDTQIDRLRRCKKCGAVSLVETDGSYRLRGEWWTSNSRDVRYLVSCHCLCNYLPLSPNATNRFQL